MYSAKMDKMIAFVAKNKRLRECSTEHSLKTYLCIKLFYAISEFYSVLCQIAILCKDA